MKNSSLFSTEIETEGAGNAMSIFHGKTGDRVRLVFMPNDPEPIPPGTEGTVKDVVHSTWGNDRYSQVAIDWDNGRRLSCICPPDFLEIIPANTNQ